MKGKVKVYFFPSAIKFNELNLSSNISKENKAKDNKETTKRILIQLVESSAYEMSQVAHINVQTLISFQQKHSIHSRKIVRK